MASLYQGRFSAFAFAVSFVNVFLLLLFFSQLHICTLMQWQHWLEKVFVPQQPPYYDIMHIFISYIRGGVLSFFSRKQARFAAGY